MFFALARVHVLLVTSPRAGPAGPVACAPFRSDAEYDYFRRTKQLELTLTKPLGAVLEEAAAGAVVVAALQDGGGAAGKLRKGDRLLCIGGIQMSSAGFDAVMDALADAPDQVDLQVSRSVVTRAPRAPPAALPVLSIDKGDTVVSGEVERGSNLRSVVQAAGVDLYPTLKAKMSNCGGAGQCNSCTVNVLEGGDNLSPRTDFEQKRLATKPGSYRLACQALVNGDVMVEVPRP